MTSRTIFGFASSLTAVAVVGSFLVAAPTPSIAQSSMPANAPAAAQPAPRSDAAVEARIKQLHDQLKITAGETEQWNAVAQAMRENESQISSLIQQRNKSAKTVNAVDDLKSYEAITDAHADGLKKLVPAFETLYDAMPDAQKKIADTVFRQHMSSRAAAQGKPAAKPANG